MRPEPTPAADTYPRLAARAAPDSEEARVLAEVDKWRQRDAEEERIYDIETEET